MYYLKVKKVSNCLEYDLEIGASMWKEVRAFWMIEIIYFLELDLFFRSINETEATFPKS